MSASNAILATAVAIDMVNAALRIVQIIQTAQMEGRDINEQDWAVLRSERAAAFQRLDDAIAKAQPSP
jgi:hypothetical protein